MLRSPSGLVHAQGGIMCRKILIRKSTYKLLITTSIEPASERVSKPTTRPLGGNLHRAHAGSQATQYTGSLRLLQRHVILGEAPNTTSTSRQYWGPHALTGNSPNRRNT